MKINLIIFISLFSIYAQAQAGKDYVESLNMHSKLGHMSKAELNKQSLNLKKNLEQNSKIQKAIRSITSKYHPKKQVLQIKNPDIIITNDKN